jgi:hypothetical protein
MAMTTKEREELEELKALVAQLQAEREEDKATITEQAEQLYDLKGQGEGWLIESNNPLYDGVTAGVRFHAGQAFIPRSRQFDLGRRDNPVRMQRQGMTAEEIAEANGRIDNTSSAEIFVDRLCADFGYNKTFFSADDGEKMNTYVNRRARERSAEMARLEEIADREA